jgi:hypothetical protein
MLPVRLSGNDRDQGVSRGTTHHQASLRRWMQVIERPMLFGSDHLGLLLVVVMKHLKNVFKKF